MIFPFLQHITCFHPDAQAPRLGGRETKHEAVIEDRYGSPSSEEVLPVLSPVRLVLVRQPVHILGIAHR